MEFWWSYTGNNPPEMIADALPDGRGMQLLRSLGVPALKQGRNAHQRGLRFLEMGMQTGQGDGCLSGVFGPAPDQGHQPRPAGNCLVPDVGTGQTYLCAAVGETGRRRHGQA